MTRSIASKEQWRGMIRRCHDPKATGYRNYGARGIKVCDRWRESYAAFVADLPPRPSPEHTLDRIDNDGDYKPGNVRWATKREQRTNSRNARLLVAHGQSRSLQEWAALTGIPKSTLFNRIKRGWTDENVVDVPVQSKAPDNTLFPPGGRRRCAELGLNAATVASRLHRGWTFDRAINTPVRGHS